MNTMTANASVAGRVRVTGDSSMSTASADRRTGTRFIRGPVQRGAELGCQRAASRPEALPLWLAALAAARCQANGNGEDRAVRWSCASGRAFYTNVGADAELIQPLGVRLRGG